jgi:hypothetical protein
MKNILIICSILVLAVVLSCTDLDPTVYSEIVNDHFFKTEEQVLSAAGPAYLSLAFYPCVVASWGLNELTTDEIILPTRGIHWKNDFMYQRLHLHTWLATDELVNNTWKVLYNGVTNCNRVIYIYEGIDDQSDALISVLNELKALRGFYYYQLLDIFGDVPIVDSFNVAAGYAPAKNTRAEVFQFVEKELKEGIPLLNNTVNMTTYARFNRYAAFTLQAKLYLNAEVFIGQPRYDEVISACDSVILSGEYELEDNFFRNFAIANESSKENIFVIPFTDLAAVDWGGDLPPRMFNHHLWTLHFMGTQTYNCEQGGWDGLCAVPSHYKSFDETDIRRNMWITGQQFSYTGDSLFCSVEKAGQPLVYTVDLTDIDCGENEGARMVKYDYTNAKNNQLSNDFAVFRYADVLLMKAEALLRKNGGVATQEAVDLANLVRARAFPGDNTKLYTTGTLTLDELLAERGREFAGEGLRRNDQIRFGVFNKPVGFRTEEADAKYNLFPIPQNQINANPNLVQSPGY